MYKIGILFDIDELESGLYGYAAYQIFFGAVDTRQLAGCTLSDGDTNATLARDANQYCISVESLDASKIATVKNALSKSNAKGLLPLTSRFIESDLVSQEPLVTSAQINVAGELVECKTGWVKKAWLENHGIPEMSEPDIGEWQSPPPPELIKKEEPEMSEVSTLFNVFIEPGRTFEDLRRKPRFILATLITVALITGFTFAFYAKIGDKNLRQFIVEQIDKAPQAQGMSAEQKQNQVDMQMTITKYSAFIVPVFVLIFFAIGGLLYWLGAKAFGGTGNFLHGLSVWVYSSLPPTVVSMIANFIVLIFKSVDEIDIATSQRGVVNANPSIFLDGKTMPVLTTVVSVLDLFLIWGWILAAIGLQKTTKISSGSAWALTIIIALIGITFRVISAYFSGNPA